MMLIYRRQIDICYICPAIAHIPLFLLGPAAGQLFLVTRLQQIFCAVLGKIWIFIADRCHAYSNRRGGRLPNYAYLGCWLPSLSYSHSEEHTRRRRPRRILPLVAAINSVNDFVCKCANAFTHIFNFLPPTATCPWANATPPSTAFLSEVAFDPSVLLSRFYYANIF